MHPHAAIHHHYAIFLKGFYLNAKLVPCFEEMEEGGNEEREEEKQTLGPLLTKHTEFKEGVGSLSQCWTVGLANDPPVVMLRAQIQGEGAAH